MRISRLRTDPKLEKSGTWVTWQGDVRLKLCRSGNPSYRRAFNEALKPYRALLRADALPDETVQRIERRCLAEHVLVGWENVLDDQDREVPYSVEQAEKYLSDPGLHDFYEFVLVAASRMENFRAEEREEDLGNSRGSSNGSAATARSRGPSESSPGKGGASSSSTGDPSSPSGSASPGEPSPSSSIPSAV